MSDVVRVRMLWGWGMAFLEEVRGSYISGSLTRRWAQDGNVHVSGVASEEHWLELTMTRRTWESWPWHKQRDAFDGETTGAYFVQHLFLEDEATSSYEIQVGGWTSKQTAGKLRDMSGFPISPWGVDKGTVVEMVFLLGTGILIFAPESNAWGRNIPGSGELTPNKSWVDFGDDNKIA